MPRKLVVSCNDCGTPVYEDAAATCYACYKAYLCEACAEEHRLQHKWEEKKASAEK